MGIIFDKFNKKPEITNTFGYHLRNKCCILCRKLRLDTQLFHSWSSAMYDPKSAKAEEFISHEEILDTLAFAQEHKADRAMIEAAQ